MPIHYLNILASSTTLIDINIVESFIRVAAHRTLLENLQVSRDFQTHLYKSIMLYDRCLVPAIASRLTNSRETNLRFPRARACLTQAEKFRFFFIRYK